MLNSVGALRGNSTRHCDVKRKSPTLLKAENNYSKIYFLLYSWKVFLIFSRNDTEVFAAYRFKFSSSWITVGLC